MREGGAARGRSATLPALILLAAITSAGLALGLSMAGAASVRADIFNILWPAKLGAGLAALLVMLAVRKPAWTWARAIGLVCAGGLVLTGAPWSMVRQNSSLPSAQPDFTVTTFNAWASNTDVDAAERWLRDAGSDVVALQEIGLNTASLPGRLLDTYPFQHRCRWGVWLISRHPFQQTGCSDQLPAAWAVIALGDDEVTITGIHLARPFAPSWYLGHSAALADLVASRSGRQIVLGDFNTGEGGFLMAGQERRLAPLVRATHGLRTWPSERLAPIPLLGIDHVWMSPELAPGFVRTGPHLGSDHRPVTVGVHERRSG